MLFGLFNYLTIYREAVDFIMAMYYDLPVYGDTYKLILKIFEVTKDFPREYKYTLGKAIETVDWDMVTETAEHNGKIYKIYLIAVVYTSG